MDRKTIIVVAVCFAFIVGWQVWVSKTYPGRPTPAGGTNALTQTQPATSPQTSAPASTPTTIGPSPTPVLIVASNAVEQTIVLTNKDARYTFTSLGGGLKSVELVNYPETISSRRTKSQTTNDLSTLNDHTPTPVLAVLGGDAVQGDGVFNLAPTEEGVGVRAEKTLTNGLRLVKEFRLGSNYLVDATVRLENTGAEPLALPEQEWVIGTATSMGPNDKTAATTVGVMWYNGVKKEEISQSWFDNRTLGCFAGVPRAEYRAGSSNVVWASVHNQFFALAAMPVGPAMSVVSRPVDLPDQNPSDASPRAQPAAQPKGFQTAFAQPAITLSPGQVLERKINLYAGPKEYRTLARIAIQFQNNVDLVMGYGGFFGFFAKGLLLGMNWLHYTLLLPYGWAIIAITVIVKLVFWPLTQISTRSTKRMAALAPELKVIQEKYKGDMQKLSQKQWELYRKHKVNPMSGCLPILIQMPVFFGFFTMIRSAIELRGEHFLWVTDLTQSDTLFVIPGLAFVPFIGIPGVGLPFNLLPLIMGATQVWQMRLTPTPAGVDPMQAKLMKYMPLMFIGILYNFSAGLTLYWTVQNLLTILQTKLTKNTAPLLSAPAAGSPLTPPPKKKK